MHSRLSLLAFAASIVGLSLALGAYESPPREANVAWRAAQPAVTLAGSYSAIAAREFQRITDNAAWREAWARHVGEHAERDSYGEVVVPSIDFDHFMVVAIFNGASWNTRSMALIDQAEINGELHLRFDAMTYQTSSGFSEESITIPGGATQEEILRRALESMEKDRARHEANKHHDPNYTRAYGVFILPRTDLPLVLIENVQSLLGEPPIWEEQQRFDAVKP